MSVCSSCGVPSAPRRDRLDRVRSGRTTSFHVGGAACYLTANAYEDGRLGEVFAKFGKEGSTLAGLMDAVSILASVGLQYGAPAEVIVEKLANTRYEPMGMTDDPDIPEASSIMDYVVRRLALDFLSREDRVKIGVLTPAEREAKRADEGYGPGQATTWQP